MGCGILVLSKNSVKKTKPRRVVMANSRRRVKGMNKENERNAKKSKMDGYENFNNILFFIYNHLKIMLPKRCDCQFTFCLSSCYLSEISKVF